MRKCQADECHPEFCETCRGILSSQWKVLASQMRKDGLQNEPCVIMAELRRLMQEVGFEVDDFRRLTREARNA